jgi:CRISPR-associated protein, cse1 family
LLAVIYTVFSRYDKNGDEVDPEDDINYLTDNWIEVFRSGKFPMKPFEKYFE